MPPSMTSQESPIQHSCYRCGKSNHKLSNCRHKNSTCNHCEIKGHLEVVCGKKKYRDNKPLKIMRVLNMVNDMPQLQLGLKLQNQPLLLEVDIGAGDNFLSLTVGRS